MVADRESVPALARAVTVAEPHPEVPEVTDSQVDASDGTSVTHTQEEPLAVIATVWAPPKASKDKLVLSKVIVHRLAIIGAIKNNKSSSEDANAT